MKIHKLKECCLRAAFGIVLGGVQLAGCRSTAPETTAQVPEAAEPAPVTPAPTPAGTAIEGLPSGWQNFTSSGGGYSVWMPGEVETRVTPVTTELGAIPAQIASAGTPDSAYLVIYADYPAEMTKADPQKILDGARSGAIKRVGGTLENEQKITINGFPGREFSALATSGEQKRFVKARIYLVRRRLYQQIVVTPQDKKPVEEINAFLNSLKIQAKKNNGSDE